jgi:hypothetical protein
VKISRVAALDISITKAEREPFVELVIGPDIEVVSEELIEIIPEPGFKGPLDKELVLYNRNADIVLVPHLPVIGAADGRCGGGHKSQNTEEPLFHLPPLLLQ